MHASARKPLLKLVLLLCSACALLPAFGVTRDGGVDPANLGKGEWLYYMSSATNQLGGYVPAVTNEDSLMSYLKSQGTRYVIVKAATSDQLFFGSYGSPQFTSNLVNVAHNHGLLIFGYNRSYGINIPGEIAVSDYVFTQGADGFIWDAEAEWESNQSWIGNNGAALAWQLCSTVRANWPNKFLAHSPFAIVSLHSSFPYKEFGYWSDAVMPQIYHFSAARDPSAAINWTDVNWTYYQNLWSNLPPTNINGLTVYWTNAIKPIAPIQDVYGPPFSSPTPDRDVQKFIDYLSADPNTPAVGGYNGANLFRADLHDAQQWAFINAGTLGAAPGVVNNIVLDNPRATVTGTAVSVRTFYLNNNTTPRFEGSGSGSDTNSFGTNYLVLAQGNGANYVEFTPNIIVAGDYTIYQWHPFRAESSAGVPFEIVYNGGSTTVYANQQTNSGTWSVLGTFNFAQGTTGKIRVRDAIAEPGGIAIADGIKLVFASPAAGPPAPPSGLTASAVGSSRIDLGWINHSTNAANNVVARATALGGPYVEAAVLPPGSTSFSDTKLVGATTYYYVVRSVNGAGSSPAAGPASATTLPAPPEIIGQPVSQTALAGASATLSVSAIGASPLTYQWRFNGTNQAGATASSYTLPSVQAGDAGNYSVVVSNAAGSVTSSEAVLTVLQGNFTLTATSAGHGTIFRSPNLSSYPAGTVVSLSATPEIGYTFSSWTGSLSSTDNPVYVTILSNMSVVGNFALSATDVVLDNTNPAVTFSGSWSIGNSAAGRYGPDYRFASTIASGSPSTATYRPTITVAGYYNVYTMYPAGANRAPSTPFTIQADNDSLSTTINQQASGGVWRFLGQVHLSPGHDVYVQVSNLAGYSGFVVMADAVRFQLSQADVFEPLITSPPQSQTIGVGDTVGFNVGALGALPLSYFWLRDGVPVPGATNSFYTLDNAQLADSGSVFSCLASNTYGTALSSSAVLTVVAYPPNIYYQPSDLALGVGDTATFSFGSYGSLPLSYSWYRNGAPIPGATGSTYTIHNVQLADSGSQFSCLLSNAFGTLLSSNAVLTVAGYPPTVFGQPQDVIAGVGEVASFSVSVAGSTPLSYLWQRNGVPIPGATNSIYTTNNVQLADSGSQFSCLVSNVFGIVSSSSAVLTVALLPTDYFAQSLGSEVTNLAFRTFTFTPDGSTNVYQVCSEPAAAFPTAPAGGTTLSLTDDSFASITLSGTNTVAVYGTRTNVVHAASNGYLTLRNGDTDYSSLYYVHFGLPRVAALFRDLNPSLGGTISWRQLTNLLAVTYQSVPIYGSSNQVNSFQVEMFFDGRIRITYLKLDAPSGLVGLSAGTGTPINFAPSDFTSYAPCGPQPPTVRQQPANQTVPVGEAAVFSVLASGTAPLSYYWRREGAPIPGATGSSYVRSNNQLADSGAHFSCLVSNAYGVMLSSNAVLTVVSSGPIVLLAADFEAGLQSFTLDNTLGNGNGMWHLSTGRALNPGHSASTSLYYGQNESPTGGGNYDNGFANGGAVISPPIHLPSTTGNLLLSFNYLMAVELAPTYDLLNVEATTNNGASYVTLAAKDAGLAHDTGGSWVSNTLDLSAFAGADVRLRFRLDTVDAVANSTEGWYLDDIVVRVNYSPRALNTSAGTKQNQPITFPIDKLLLFASDSDGDPLSLSVSATSTNGGSVLLSGGSITYMPVNGFIGADRFTYTVSDGRGGSASAFVLVQVRPSNQPSGNMLSPVAIPGGWLVNFAGIPGRTYTLQRAGTPTGPWITLGPVTVGPSGIATFADTNAPPAQAFYRTVYP